MIEQVTAYRFNSQDQAMYVANLKGDGGADWGYCYDIAKTIPLNRNQWHSFAKDMRECGTVAFCLTR